jgi:hypothetical protein
VEDYRQGYPRLAAFLTLDKNFSILKRFDYLHIRSLLDLQDQLSDLQDQLKVCEDFDRVQLGLSSRRQDGNRQRRDLLECIRSTLEVYGACMRDIPTRHIMMLNFKAISAAN